MLYAGPTELHRTRPGRAWRLTVATLLVCGVFVLSAPIARADDDAATNPMPRTAIEIGGASVVLVASKDNLYAFVDRIDDNTPLADAQLTVDSADGRILPLSKATDGLFVAPLNRTGHLHDVFMVKLSSAAGTGSAPAEIVYDDLPQASGGDVGAALSTRLAIALVAGGIGLVVGASGMLWMRGGLRRGVARPLGSAQAT